MTTYLPSPRLLAVVVAVLAALAAAVVLAAPSQADHDHGKILKLTGKTLAVEQVDAGKPGPSLGDANVITEDVYRDGKRVGTSDIHCTVVRLDPAAQTFEAQCLNTTTLAGGQITAQGIVRSDQLEQAPFTQAVTGGTGIYSGVGGQLTVDEAGDGPAKFTFALTR
jgi:hypothetical protein